MLWTGWVVKRSQSIGLANGQLLGGGQMQSFTAGSSWTAAQYAIAYGGLLLGTKLFGRMVDPTKFRQGGMHLIFAKLAYTEVIARSPWAAQQFGRVPARVAYSPRSGQTWLSQGGQYSAMQGLVDASPLDGLVDASPLDGKLRSGYGGLLPSITPPDEADRARWDGSGYTSQYNAAYA